MFLKYIYRPILVLLCTAQPFLLRTQPVAQNLQKNRTIERIHISTDRPSYLAGESVWLSLFCVDAAAERPLSTLSSIAYIEIHSASSMLLTAKVAVVNGRGSGRLELPPNTPTGNYKLIAYTKQMLNEESPSPFEMIIPIYNVLSTERVKGNVEHDSKTYTKRVTSLNSTALSRLGKNSPLEVKYGVEGKVIESGEQLSLTIRNTNKSKLSFNISVYKLDSLYEYKNRSITENLSNIDPSGISFTDRFVPEYEGEIIEGKVEFNGIGSIWDKFIFFSVAGGESDVYSSIIDSSGRFTIYTNPIFGNRDAVLEIPSEELNGSITYDITDPFIKEFKGEIPPLYLLEQMESSLKERGLEMQIGRRFNLDTLYQSIPINKDPLLRKSPVVYKLDDYTRFPVMREVVIEYIPELRFRKVNGKHDLQVRMADSFNSLIFSKESSLVLLDGLPIFDHTLIHDYDPLKVKSISIYGFEHFIGTASFTGLVSFKTYKGDYSGLNLNKSIRILDYQGALYPCKMTGEVLNKLDNFPDMRTMLFWDPSVEIEGNGKQDVNIFTSSMPGTYRIVIEGISLEGDTFEYTSEFIVR